MSNIKKGQELGIKAQLIKDEELYYTFFINSMDAILLTSPDGAIYSANPAACNLFQRSEAEICKLGRNGVVDVGDPHLLKAIKERARKGSFYGEIMMVKKSGRKFPAEISSEIFLNKDGMQLTTLIIRDISDRKKTEKKLKESKVKLQKLARHLGEIRENERSQIALNLHDDLGQKLTALNLDIAWLRTRIGVQSQPVKQKFEEMSSMIKETIEGIREISAFLRPLILFELGLIPAFDWQINKFEKQSAIKCFFKFEPKDIKLNDNTSLILYRILQESLTNVARHSGATKVEISLRLTGNKIELLISDNGIGIDKGRIKSTESMGLAGINERVRSVSGHVSIKGEKGSGSIIKVLIPVMKRYRI